MLPSMTKLFPVNEDRYPRHLSLYKTIKARAPDPVVTLLAIKALRENGWLTSATEAFAAEMTRRILEGQDVIAIKRSGVMGSARDMPASLSDEEMIAYMILTASSTNILYATGADNPRAREFKKARGFFDKAKGLTLAEHSTPPGWKKPTRIEGFDMPEIMSAGDYLLKLKGDSEVEYVTLVGDVNADPDAPSELRAASDFILEKGGSKLQKQQAPNKEFKDPGVGDVPQLAKDAVEKFSAVRDHMDAATGALNPRDHKSIEYYIKAIREVVPILERLSSAKTYGEAMDIAHLMSVQKSRIKLIDTYLQYEPMRFSIADILREIIDQDKFREARRSLSDITKSLNRLKKSVVGDEPVGLAVMKKLWDRFGEESFTGKDAEQALIDTRNERGGSRSQVQFIYHITPIFAKYNNIVKWVGGPHSGKASQWRLTKNPEDQPSIQNVFNAEND